MKMATDHRVSFLKMFSIFLPIMVVMLGLVVGNNGQQYTNCDYSQHAIPGAEYFIYNKEYPQNYGNDSSCRWIITSDHPVQLKCDITIPPTDGCSGDFLKIRDSVNSTSRNYCGIEKFAVTSKSHDLKIIFESSSQSKGGNFVCRLKAIDSNTDEYDCNCGWKNPTRIVGGEETGVNEFPMMAGLVDFNKRKFSCGATIINEKQVMTAAHCVSKREPSNFGIFVGDHDLTTGNDSNATRLFTAAFFHIHPLYQRISSDYDIAIVTIKGKIKYSHQVGPVCLPFQHSGDAFVDKYVELLGWGRTEFNGEMSDTLQKVRVRVVTNEHCSNHYSGVSPRQICTLEKDKDSCQHDSGGPVLWQNPLTRRIVGVGVTSTGFECADGIPAMNTRVGAFIDWIESVKPRGIMYCKIE